MQIRLPAALLTAGLTVFAYCATPAIADEWNKRTTFTFNQPVEVPGHVLVPGQYVFELANLQADRNVVQIFSQDHKGMDRLVTTQMAVPDYHLNTPQHASVTFEERKSDSPEAVHSWSYPGDNYGWEFIYPKAQQLTIAENTIPAPVHAAVPAPAPEPAVAAAPPPKRAEAAPTPVTKPAEQPVTLAQNKPPAAQNQAPAQLPAAAAPKTLPQTGSDLPLGATFGALLLALGAGTLAIKRNVQD
jgi:LPXTG-motif cell wall-anchored protein